MCDSPQADCGWRTTPMWREQAETEWALRVISIVTCCHSVKLCAHAARAFQSQQGGALTRMWRWCQVQPSQKERAIDAVRWKRRGCCCNLSVDVVLKVRFTTTGCALRVTPIYMWREQAIIEWSRRVISIIACWHCVKLCALATRASRSQHKKYKPTSLSFACPIFRVAEKSLVSFKFPWS